MTARAYLEKMGLKKPASKYKNKKKVLDGIEFDSVRESRRYQDLFLMQAAGQISQLRRQVPYAVYINNIHICDWRADFEYLDATGKCVTEDSKGCRTEVYRLKKKMVEAFHGIRILET